MRTLARFLSLLLCLELIVSPIAPNLSLLAQNAHAEDCPTGFTFDSTLNRCLTKTETANVMNATMACGSDVQCYKQNAQQALQDKVSSGEAPDSVGGGGFVSGVANIAAVAGPVSMMALASSESASKCASYSFYAIVAGSVSLIVGDNLANMQHKSRLKKIKEDWGKIVNPEQANGDKDKERSTSIEAQSQAFEMLARAEDSLAKSAKMKKTFFTIAAVAYGVSTLIATAELIMEKMPTTGAAEKIKNTCTEAPKGGGDSAATGTTPATNVTASPPPAAPVSEAVGPGPGETINVDGQEIVPFESPNYRFESLIEGKTFTYDSKIRKQFQYNMQNSNDLAALIINQKASELAYSSPSIEYYETLKGLVEKSEFKDESVFKTFKDFSVTVFANLNPISDSYAVEAQDAVAENSDSGSSSGSGSTSASTTSSGQNSASSSSPGVKTNAAKAYKEDEGKGINWMTLGVGVAAGIAAKKLLGKQMISTEGRLIFSGVMTGMSLIMAGHAGKQAKASEKRAELLRKMKDEFASASGAIYSCKSEDRNDPAKPNCYCYTAENQRNSSRGNSQICQKLWAGINTKANSYSASTQGNRVCVNQNRQADSTCACRSTNTCMKVSLSGVKGLSLGTNNMLNGALAPMNGVANGSIDPATLDSASLANQAAKMQKLAGDLQKDSRLASFNKNKDKAALELQKKMSNAASGMSGSGLLGSSGSSSMPSNPGDAARMLDKEIADQAPTGVSGAQTITAGSDSAPEQPLEFGLTGDQLAAQESQIAEAMKQDLDYNNNDINQGSKTNIFEVLSNRYQRSGMRRLFDEKGETKPESAAKSDITQ